MITVDRRLAMTVVWLVVILVVLVLVLALGVFIQRRRRAGGVIATRKRKQ
jgi:preprotein translocase subunit SecG